MDRPLEKYKPPVGVRLRNWVALAIWLAAVYQTLLNPVWLFDNPVVWWAGLGIYALWMAANALLYPTITATRQELRLYYPWGLYKKIPWQFVIAIRASQPTKYSMNKYSESFIAVEAHTLNPFYALLGKLFDRGGRLFLLFRYQEGYHGLLDDFEEYAPHALAQELKE